MDVCHRAAVAEDGDVMITEATHALGIAVVDGAPVGFGSVDFEPIRTFAGQTFNSAC